MRNVKVVFPRTIAADNQHVYSLSCWFRPRSITNFQSNLIQTSNLHSRINLGNYLDSRVKVHVFETLDLKEYETLASDDVRVNRWHHAVLVVDPGNTLLQLYVDGVLSRFCDFAAKGVTSLVPITSGIMMAGGVDIFYDGYLDQGEAVKVARNADWVKLAYASQKSAQTIVAFEDGTHAMHTRRPAAGIRTASWTQSSAGYLQVTIDHDTPADFALYNAQGQLVRKLAADKNRIMLSTRDLGNGVYCLAADFNGQKAVIPFVVE
jgi:hypothetical protein